MSETTFTFRVDAQLKERFTEVAREHDRAGSQVLRELMRTYVSDAATYDAWFRMQVQAALDDPRAAVPSAVVERRFARRRAAAQRKRRAHSR